MHQEGKFLAVSADPGGRVVSDLSSVNKETTALNPKISQTRAQQIQHTNPPTDSRLESETAPETIVIVPLPPPLSLSSRHSGLKNLGFTCYINSGLQCLAAIDGLVRCLQKRNHLKQFEEKPFIKAFGEVLLSLRQTAGCVVPDTFLKTLKDTFEIFNNRRQHDAQEFISLTLDHVHEETKNDDGISIIRDLFEGIIVKSFLCEFGHVWELNEKFYELSVPIPERKLRGFLEDKHVKIMSHDDLLSISKRKHRLVNLIKGLLGPNYGAILTLYHCLDIYNEDITTELFCSQCNTTKQVRVSTLISQAPNVLMITLKRFTHRLSKEDSFVFLPTILKINDLNYKLASFLSHRGSISRGHYIAYVKSDDHGWLKMNDSSCSAVSADEAQQQQAYVVFYERVH